MNGGAGLDSMSSGVEAGWSIRVLADFNGAGKPDLIRQNTITGERGVWFMDGTTAGAYQIFATVGTEWRIGN